MRVTRTLLAAAVALSLVAAGCGSSDDNEKTSSAGAESATSISRNADNAKVTLTIGSKNFTEQKVLGEIYAQALTAAGYTVHKALNLGDEKVALAALKSGEISAYPEYTGTALLSFFDVPTDRLPKSSASAYEHVKADFAKRGIVAMPPTPFTSSNEVGVNGAEARKLGLVKISDLKGRSQDLKLYGTPECRQRLDCLLGLEKIYGLKFKSVTPVDPALRHEVLEKGQADLSIVFTTDPQNKRDRLVLLKDDKSMFAPYNSTLLVKKATVEKAGPDLEKVVVLVNKGLDAAAMQELNARVDLDKETPEQAASQYLRESGYVK